MVPYLHPLDDGTNVVLESRKKYSLSYITNDETNFVTVLFSKSGFFKLEAITNVYI